MRKLILEGDDIVGFEMDGAEIHLKERIPVIQYDRLKPVLEATEKIDLVGTRTAIRPAEEDGASAEWTDKNLAEFMEHMTEAQKAYLEVLAANGDEWMLSPEIRERLKKKIGKQLEGSALAGIRSGLTRKAKNWYECESIDESIWDNDEWKARLRIRPKYLARLRKLLGLK